MPKGQKFYQKPFTLHDLPKEERPRERLKKVGTIDINTGFDKLKVTIIVTLSS